jgi:hypothetical protein
MGLRAWKFGLAAALAGVFGITAQAGLLPLTATVAPEGDNFRYSYSIMLTSNSSLTKGDMFVIYDFAGYIPGSEVQPFGFTFATMGTGGNPGRTIPNDNPELPNLVWTYDGDIPLVGQIGLGDFSVLSSNPESAIDTDFVSRTQVEDSDGNPREEDNITKTKAPLGTNDPGEPTDPTDPTEPENPSGVPEPSTMLLMGVGLPLVAGVRYMRRRREEAAIA